MASLTCERAEAFCRQFSTRSCFNFPNSFLATFLTSARSSVLSPGVGRVRMSNTTSSYSERHSLTWRSCSSFKLRLSAKSSLKSSSMFRLPTL